MKLLIFFIAIPVWNKECKGEEVKCTQATDMISKIFVILKAFLIMHWMFSDVMIPSEKWTRWWGALADLEGWVSSTTISSKTISWCVLSVTPWREWWVSLTVIDFSRLVHQKAHKGGKTGNFVCQTFVSSSTVGKDGKVNTQSYFEN